MSEAHESQAAMNTPNKHDPERVRSAAVPIYDVTIAKTKTKEHYSMICWIDTSNRADIAGLYQKSIDEVRAIEGGTLNSYFMYDVDVFYLMLESSYPHLHDLSLPLSVTRYRRQLKFLCEHEASILIEPGPQPIGWKEQVLPIILSIPLLDIHRTELFDALAEWQLKHNKLN